ncbi:MAG TPA: hypothetical protein GX399_18560 [Xanthomonadaceae bacterium]|nr:hypothetical protein [Xanthomonadaceae bacterium]
MSITKSPNPTGETMLRPSSNARGTAMSLLPTALLVLLIGLLQGCISVMAYRFYVLEPKMTADGLVFTSPVIEQGLKENKRYVLTDLEVYRHPCLDPKSCTMWKISRPLDMGRATLLQPSNWLSLPIRYGQSYPNMEVRTGPLPLPPGRYSVTGGVVESNDGVTIDDDLPLIKCIAIKKNAAGALEVEDADCSKNQETPR